MRCALLLAALAVPSPAGAAPVVALDAGAPLWDGVLFEDKVDAVASTGAAMVRLNFRIDRWTWPGDQTPQGPEGLTFFEAYDRLVDAYLARGVQVYGLLNDELVATDAPIESEEFIAAYTASAIAVIDHFKDRIRVWEVFNEPNDWAGGTDARLDAYWFARLLQETYLEVKHHAGHIDDPCWQVTLISGPLFSFDGTTAADYLAQVYDIGRNQLAWDWTHEQTGSYPLDGVGYHIYVRQGAGDTLAEVSAGVTAHVSAIWQVVEASEGPATDKRIWVSEYGWRADVVGPDAQADRLETAYRAMHDSQRVAAAFYFQLQDFPDNQWGLFDAGGLDEAHRRPAADRLAALAAEFPWTPDADGCGGTGEPDEPEVAGDAPPTVGPGADGDDPAVGGGCATGARQGPLVLLLAAWVAWRRGRARTRSKPQTSDLRPRHAGEIRRAEA